MKKEYEYIEIENVFSVYAIENNKNSKKELISKLKEGWEIFRAETIGTKECIYKMYILRKEKKESQQKIYEE